MKKASLLFFITAAATAAASSLSAADTDFIWQQAQAEVSASGTLAWQPQPFVFRAGDVVRYIDYEAGADANPGTRQAPWKHHPWDERATGRAAAGVEGAATYVFKRGVTYRGALVGSPEGTPLDPIRLTSDPGWGRGEALIVGSHPIRGGWKRGGEGLSEKLAVKDEVWFIDLPAGVEPRNLWLLDGEKITVLDLAAIHQLRFDGDDDDRPKKHWPRVPDTADHIQFDGHWRYHPQLRDGVTPRDPDYFGGDTFMLYESGAMMGTISPSRIYDYDPETHRIVVHSFFPKTNSREKSNKRIIGGCRYTFRNNPLFIDEPGEWYFAASGPHKGRLYLLPPEGIDPNDAHFEAGRHVNLIRLDGARNLEISGLSFRFTNLPPRLDWTWEATPGVIVHRGSGENIAIRNNVFEHVNQAVQMDGIPEGGRLDDVVVADNRIYFADNAAIWIDGRSEPPSGLGEVRLLRNDMYFIGLRPVRMENGHAVHLGTPEVSVIAGNFLHRIGGWGIAVTGGKRSGRAGDAPLSRQLIFNNSVTDPMLISNDWGGIETWQGGPFYVFNNAVHNPIGILGFNNRRFGHAY